MVNQYILRLIAGLFALCLLPFLVHGQPRYTKKLREGDIIFQKLPCGGLCDAIIATTPCKPDMAFNHCGIVHLEKGQPYVIEAIGKAVQQTPMSTFVLRDSDKVIYIGRVNWFYTSVGNWCMSKGIEKARHYIGTPYDDAFLPGDTALYCSELIWECYRSSTGKPLFPLLPMTFKSPSTGTTFPAWDAYYKELGIPVPEGVAGINPCAIANAPLVEMMAFRK